LASAGLRPVLTTTQETEVSPTISLDRVTVKVNTVTPESPSNLLASVAEIDIDPASSLRITPIAVAEVIVALTGFNILTTNLSVGSISVSPLTLIVMIRVAWPGEKETVL
jgi:hypothetical protein